MLRKRGMIQLPYGDRKKDEVEIIIDRSWTCFCDLENWVRDMSMRGGQEVNIPKAVLKMAMRNLMDQFELIHTLAAQIQEDKENAGRSDI